tara:strand:- start:65918 stop:67723 length:1806 start_codon:yes stop_codon:yes gene_type:complete
MKKNLLIGLMMASSVALAQKNDSPNYTTNSYQGSEISFRMNKQLYESESIENWLKNEFELGSDIELELEKSINSLTALHLHYQVKIQGIPVFDGKIHVVKGNDGIIQKVIQNQVPLTVNESFSAFPISELEELKDEYDAQISSEEKIWFPKNGQLIAANVAHLENSYKLNSDIIYSNGEILHEINKIKHFHADGPNDSLINGYIFEPDPLTTAMQDYGSPYIDFNDSALTILENEKKQKQVLATFSNGIFELKNDFVEIINISQPNIAPPVQTNPDFLFRRSQTGFEDVNVLYHLTEHKLHMDALGFTNIPGYTIQVDPHALGGDDNSQFNPTIPGRLQFGEGGVDDAEDADVIIHEYIHAYINAATGSNSGTTERETLDECLGDYFAASYSRSINNYNQDHVFSWDGHNEFWAGRLVESTKDYKQISFNGGIYQHTDLFASPLMEAYGILGRNTVDQIVMEAIFSLGSSTTFSQMAKHIIDADQNLNGGANFAVLKTAFVRRNILDATFSLDEKIENEHDIKVYGSFEFSQGGELIIESKLEGISSYRVYDMTAKPILESDAETSKNKIRLNGSVLKSGFYLLEIVLEDGFKKTYKLSRS